MFELLFPLFLLVLLFLLLSIIWRINARKYISSSTVASAYDAWTQDKLLERLWGEHIHLGFYPSGKNIDEELIEILNEPTKRKNSKEAFRGFINLFDDYLATDLFDRIDVPIQLIWGEKDPWESLSEAKDWKKKFNNIKRLDVIKGAGHCPHDEEPEKTNELICEFLQETK